MNRLAFLTWLISLGPKLPQLFAELEKIVAAVTAIAGIVGKPAPDTGGLEVLELSAEEQAAEAEVAALIAGPTAAFDGSRIRALVKFYQDNKALFDFLFGLIGKGG